MGQATFHHLRMQAIFHSDCGRVVDTGLEFARLQVPFYTVGLPSDNPRRAIKGKSPAATDAGRAFFMLWRVPFL
jgi:hypothetical protein